MIQDSSESHRYKAQWHHVLTFHSYLVNARFYRHILSVFRYHQNQFQKPCKSESRLQQQKHVLLQEDLLLHNEFHFQDKLSACHKRLHQEHKIRYPDLFLQRQSYGSFFQRHPNSRG